MNGLNARQLKILELVKQRDSITTSGLIEEIGASPATIRKDVAFLASLRLVYRVRGEVHALGDITANVNYRKSSNQRVKRDIAEAALGLIAEGDTIILDSGTTTLELARLLPGVRNLTVITFSLDIANALQDAELNLIVIGGQYHRPTSSFVGPEAAGAFSNIRAQKLFLTASGIRENSGLTVYNSLEGEIKKAAIGASTEVIALIDSSKLNNACVYQFATFDSVDALVTDSAGLTGEFTARLKEKNVRLILSDKK